MVNELDGPGTLVRIETAVWIVFSPENRLLRWAVA